MADTITQPSGGAMVAKETTAARPSFVLPGETWTPGQSQAQYEQGQGKLAPGVPSVLSKPDVSSTTASNLNKMNAVPGIINTTNQYANSKGITTDNQGVARYANGSLVPSSPYEQYTNYVNNGGSASMEDWESGSNVTGTKRPANDNAKTNADGTQGVITGETASEDARIQANIDKLQSESDSITAGIIESIKSSYTNLINQQKDINSRQEKGTSTSLLMGGVTGGGGSSQYAPISSQGIIQSQLSYGLSQIADLNAKEESALQVAKQAQLNNDFKFMDAQNALITKIRDEKVALATKQNELILTANQKLADDKLQASKDEQIGQILASGTTDPAAILKLLKAQGITTITADDIKKTLDNLNPHQQAITDIMKAAAQNQATPDVISKIGQAKTVEEALAAAGIYAASASGTMGDYLSYKRDALANGLTPSSFDDWQKKQDQRAINVKSAEAYATEAGKLKADQAFGGNDTTTPVDPDSKSILAQTGLSVQAFNFLTQGTSSLSRLSSSQRTAIMKEAENWANKNGVDVSTFQSQYKAYNTVLEKNIERSNNTKIFSGEVSGTVDQFITDVGKDYGKLRPVNVTKLLLGQQFNDPTVQKYAFDLQTMQNDLAGYYAASRGATAPDDADLRAAANVIASGLGKGNAQAFKDSINTNEEKVTGVVDHAVNNARKQVWDLFGVGGNFKPPAITEDQAKSKVDSWVTANPKNVDKVQSLFNVPGATNADIYDYMKQHPEVFGNLK